MSGTVNASLAEDREWGRCSGWIIAALETSPGFESIEDVERKIASTEYQLWAGRNCAAVTCISTYDRRKVLTVLHGGGDLDELLNELEPVMCKWAALNGCDGITGEGRWGWKPVCEKRGYRLAFVTMIKDLKA